MIFNLLSRFWIAVIKSLRHMPVSARSALAGFLALLFWIAIPKRRRVTLTNLRLCFPNKTDAERKKIAKSFYRKLMRAALDHGVLWSGTREEVAAMVRFEGVENITETVARGEHLIVISPHFVGHRAEFARARLFSLPKAGQSGLGRSGSEGTPAFCRSGTDCQARARRPKGCD